MRHVSYGETVFTTDERIGALLLEYATVLAVHETADTVTLPGRVGGGAVETVSLLVGPASQITSWSDDEPFGEDVAEAAEELERRIRRASADTAPSALPVPPGAIDDFDELA